MASATWDRIFDRRHLAHGRELDFRGAKPQEKVCSEYVRNTRSESGLSGNHGSWARDDGASALRTGNFLIKYHRRSSGNTPHPGAAPHIQPNCAPGATRSSTSTNVPSSWRQDTCRHGHESRFTTTCVCGKTSQANANVRYQGDCAVGFCRDEDGKCSKSESLKPTQSAKPHGPPWRLSEGLNRVRAATSDLASPIGCTEGFRVDMHVGMELTWI